MIVARHSGRDAGQIGRTADLHGLSARKVKDTDVPHASSHKDVKLWTAKSLETNICAIGKLPSMALDSGIPAGMTAFLARPETRSAECLS